MVAIPEMVRLAGFASVTCPHCFGKFSPRRAIFRCASDNCVASKVVSAVVNGAMRKFNQGDVVPAQVDPILKSMWEDASPLNHTFAPSGFVSRFLTAPATLAFCPVSNARTTQKLCPNCHKTVHSTIGRESDLVMTLVGGSNSGKSHYIAVLIQELATSKGRQFDFAAYPLDPTTGPLYTNSYFQPLYRDKQALSATHKVTKRSASVAPLVYALRFPGDRVVALSLFDPPGEGVINESHVEKYHHFVFNSAGLVLLLDGEKLLSSNSAGDQLSDANRALEIAVRQLNAQHGGRANRMPHIAIAVSKADLLRSKGLLASHFWQEPNHARGFDEDDFKIVSSEVQRLISKHGGVKLCQIAENTFGRERVGYFAFSALGGAPTGTAVSKIEPVRVAEPFLWLLSRHGAIPCRSAI